MENILEAHHISKTYAKHQALKDVSLLVPKGAIFGLLGPNGAGKTTLIRIINQIISRDEGEIRFLNEDLAPHHIASIGYLPEERGLYKKMKVGEQLLYLAQLKGLSRKNALERLKQWFIKFDIKTWWDKKIEDLSKGMQQKVQFVATVLHEPPLIILDEPFSGFDPVNANLIKNEILELRQKGSTIIFSTHRMESVEELCDYVALIHQSQKILDGPKNDIKNQFRSFTYLLEFEGVLNSVGGTFEILESLSHPQNGQQAILKAGPNVSANALLQALIQQVEVRSFQERIPSMNDIFIRLVTGQDPSATLQQVQSREDVTI
ncbi:MAG: ABC transporter ATP-binding protein [Microscillaceae bacterium]